jgi:hypothetical protein
MAYNKCAQLNGSCVSDQVSQGVNSPQYISAYYMALGDSLHHSFVALLLRQCYLGWKPSVQVDDPAVGKYIAMGLNKEAVVMAIRTLGDVQNKVGVSLFLCLSGDGVYESGAMSTAVRTLLTKLLLSSLCSDANK